MPLLERGKLDAERGVLLLSAMGVAFELLHILPGGFERHFLLVARPFLFGDGLSVALLLLDRALGLAAQTVELEASHRQAGIGAGELFGQLPPLVIERQGVLLL